MSDEPDLIDLDIRPHLNISLGGKKYVVHAPPLSKAADMAEIHKRMQGGGEALKNSDAEGLKVFAESIADYIALHTTEIPREEIMKLDMATGLRLLKATQGLLPKGEASPVPAPS